MYVEIHFDMQIGWNHVRLKLPSRCGWGFFYLPSPPAPLPREREKRKELKMAQQVTEKYEETYLYKIRHSAAHVMAEAVLEIYPDAKIAIGPPIDTGLLL